LVELEWVTSCEDVLLLAAQAQEAADALSASPVSRAVRVVVINGQVFDTLSGSAAPGTGSALILEDSFSDLAIDAVAALALSRARVVLALHLTIMLSISLTVLPLVLRIMLAVGRKSSNRVVLTLMTIR
jgi:hypothetical protein